MNRFKYLYKTSFLFVRFFLLYDLTNNPTTFKFYRYVNPFDLDQSTPFFNCSSVRKIRIVVGWRRVHAGTQPLNMNIGPSFFIDCRMTARVD